MKPKAKQKRKKFVMPEKLKAVLRELDGEDNFKSINNLQFYLSNKFEIKVTDYEAQILLNSMEAKKGL